MHFGHKNIIKYCNRPFSSVQEMDETLIKNINECVKYNDTLYHLGDFAFGNIERYRSNITCLDIHLILGNHDKIQKWQYRQFSSVSHYKEVNYNKTKIVLCHYALRVWNKSHHGAWHLYGHSHGTLPDIGNKSFDCGVDCWNYKPLSINDIEKEMNKRNFEAVDHHGENNVRR